jgi:hypothetical protein
MNARPLERRGGRKGDGVRKNGDGAGRLWEGHDHGTKTLASLNLPSGLGLKLGGKI